MGNQTKPLITVVTVCYNAVDELEKTMLSVLNQTYDNIEYIVIDGGSTDGTVDILKKYADRLAYWKSESDKGIFNAMNKGILKSTGDWICFINSGDFYYSNNVFDSIFNKPEYKNADVIYGEMLLDYSFGLFHVKPASLSSFNLCFPFSHPACFVKLSLMKQFLFNDSKYKLAADYDFFFKLYKMRKVFVYNEQIVSVFEAENGASSKNRILTYQEVSMINGQINSPNYSRKVRMLSLKSKILDLLSTHCRPVYILIMNKSILKYTNIRKYNEKDRSL